MSPLRLELPTEPTPDQQAYLQSRARGYMSAGDIAACTCLHGGPFKPTPAQKIEIQASRDNCPLCSRSGAVLP